MFTSFETDGCKAVRLFVLSPAFSSGTQQEILFHYAGGKKNAGFVCSVLGEHFKSGRKYPGIGGKKSYLLVKVLGDRNANLIAATHK